MDESELNKDGAEYLAHKDFTSLKAWQKCQQVKLFFYKTVIPLLPPEEKYSLSQQIRRASVSITANISEGYGRYHYQEGIQFYRIGRGSLYELKDHLITCVKLNFIEKKIAEEGFKLIEEAKKILNGFINYQKKQKGKMRN